MKAFLKKSVTNIQGLGKTENSTVGYILKSEIEEKIAEDVKTNHSDAEFVSKTFNVITYKTNEKLITYNF